ncbi:MAG: dihydrodipicolinate synthase family protein [Acidimicrobiia bacterium]|nr:dihydrodipicolinate synthase family protein [Acidimicrobiia bacterium]NNF87973.1 dihydrodipicolinate synthase family protein [Acidimicrobiia bacterium]NNJ48265.1 dihydrodipicolinate synthase family protein [Acidimicrobiia bacterium]NNL13784.1 dihydrodipicolinate synthase family protein [Acidimicrobiia bacterium]NNL97179.1 dihydrodipicolinate synthase family protein [Acidimicrobiia bacterium]
MTSLSGVWAASLTPVTSDLAPDPDRLGDHVARLLADGCDGIVLFGTTGEATSFSVAERVDLLDRLVAGGVEPARVIVGVGCAAAVDTVALTRAAATHDVAGVLMLPPFYYKAVTDEDLMAAYRWIFDQIGPEAPPVLLYNIPQVSGVKLSASLAGRLASEYPDIVKGLKDSSGDLDSLRGFLAAMPGTAVFAGTELLLVPGLAEGAVGTISAAANINAGQIRTAFESQAAADVDILRQTRAVLATRSVIPALKAVVAQRRNDPGWATVRPPLRALASESGAALAAALPVA